jgi:hypothetical protein
MHVSGRLDQPSAGSWSNACDGYRCPSGAVIATSRQPSSASSAAFFNAAAAVSRRSVMLPEVSVPVIKNRMCDPNSRSLTHRQFKPATYADDRRARIRRLGNRDSEQAREKQDRTCDRHGEKAVRSEFITHKRLKWALRCWPQAETAWIKTNLRNGMSVSALVIRSGASHELCQSSRPYR